jgi:DNA-binding response OmpR family regulator
MRVLIVEDERRLAENIARSLREIAGYAVDLAGDGPQGLQLASGNAYDLIILRSADSGAHPDRTRR